MSSAALRRLCEDAWEHPNVQAWAHVIREGESSQSDAQAYRMQVGGASLRSLDDHPRMRVLVERLKVYSTAAGAYQILERTWDEAASALGLTDFGPRSQDLAMVFLTRRRGALDDVVAGRLDEAVRKCALEWASLPGDAYGQGGLDIGRARRVFVAWGGTLAEHMDAPAPVSSGATDGGATPEGSAPEVGAPAVMPGLGEGDQTMVAPAIAVAGGELLIGLAKSIWSAFTPLATEKLTREISRNTKSPEIASQVAQATITAVQGLTSIADPVRATAKALDSPAIIAKVEASVLDELDRLAPLIERMHKLDREERADIEASREAAAKRPNSQDAFMTRALFLMVGFIIVAGVVAMVIMAVNKVDATATMAVFSIVNALALVIGNKLSTRIDFSYGSSDGSRNKDAVRDAVLTQIAKPGAAR